VLRYGAHRGETGPDSYHDEHCASQYRKRTTWILKV